MTGIGAFCLALVQTDCETSCVISTGICSRGRSGSGIGRQGERLSRNLSLYSVNVSVSSIA